MARRVVAVEQDGHAIPLSVVGPFGGTYFNTHGQSTRRTQYTNTILRLPKTPLRQIREFRLLTRPYQWVEFRSVPLQPRHIAAASSSAPGAATSELRGKVVVVDPGHGGQDSGAVGAGGVTEKSLNLAIAQRLRAELERRGATVFLTRDGDTYLDTMERPRLAVADHADYLIGVHCDDRLPQVYGGPGARVYYHGQAPLERQLAGSIGTGIGRSTGESSRVVSDLTRFSPGGFGILRGASMPAVLVECGDMAISGDLARLRDPQGQQRIAAGIAAGLSAFRLPPKATAANASGQARAPSRQAAERGPWGWIVLPTIATTQPLTFQERAGGKLRCTLRAEKGYDPSTGTLRQVTITQYRNGRVGSIIGCDAVQWRGGQFTTTHPVHVTANLLGGSRRQTLTISNGAMTFGLFKQAITIHGR